MSTHSTISVVLPNGRVRTVYCHFDGYLMGVGRTLLSFWNTQELAEQITSIGDMNDLGQRIDPIGYHTFLNPESGTCVFFGRDNKELNCEPRLWISLSEYYLIAQFEDYNYLFNDGVWHVSEGSAGRAGMKQIEFTVYGSKVVKK